MREEPAAAGESRRPLLRSRPLAPLALAAAVAVPVLVEGGFTSGSRSLFVGLALIALAVAMARDERPLAELARSPVVLCLAALGVLSVASAAWTVGEAGAAVRSGLVIGALAAVALVAGFLTRLHGVRAIAALLVALAVGEAAVGLVSAALHAEPWAQRIGGSWRPGGTFEYPPALVLLQVSALPALGWAMLAPRRAVAVAGAAAAAMAGMVVGLADSRVGLALALGLIVAAILAARPVLGVATRRVALCGAVPLAAGAVAHLVIGGYAPPAETGGDAGRVLAVGLIAAGAAGGWSFVLRALAAPARVERRPVAIRPFRPSRSRRDALLAAGAAAIVGVAALAAFSGDSAGEGVEPVSGFDHGRSAEWAMAVDVALERPLAGAGADSYAGAAALQEGEGASTLYPHSLPLEAWAELGPLGLALVVGVYVGAAVLLWRLRREPRAWLFAPAVAAFLLANLVDWPWHLAGAGAVWAAALGACLALDAERRLRPRV